jgi:hypothetical protein
MPTPLGRPIVVAGRLASADAPDEVMVNEAFVRQYDVGLGDRLRLQAFAAGETEHTPADRRRSPAVEARIVGVVRTLQDLSAANEGGGGEVSATIFTRPGWTGGWARRAFFSAVLVQARGDDATRARSAIDAAFPDRLVNNQYGSSADDEVPLRDAYHYEAEAALAVAALTALAALVFVGQASPVRFGESGRRRRAPLDRPVAPAGGACRSWAGRDHRCRRGGGRRRDRHRSLPRRSHRPRP